MRGGPRRLLFEVSAPVMVTVEELRALIDDGWLLRQLGWDVRPEGPGPSSGPGVGLSNGVVSLQGGWWYRGEYTAETVRGRASLVHRVFNVARQGRWAPALANRLFIGYRAAMQRGTDDLARRATEAVRA